ncbi:MAG: anti-sigma factor family protein [Candidatus Sulfotelmatobacter sp.]
MACERWSARPEQFDRYLDGELDAAEARALRTHLRECASCAADVLERMQMKRAVHAAGRPYEPSAEFRAKIAKSVAAKPRLGAGERWRMVLVPALLLVLGAFLLTSYLGRERAARQRVYSELADLHVATLASSTPVDVVSSDRHTVKPWFQGKIPFTFNLPELGGTDFTLVGGRVAYLEQISGAHLIYRIRKHEISVFIFPESAGSMRGLPSGTANAASFNSDTWTQNGLRYFVIGDASADDIRALGKLLRGV